MPTNSERRAAAKRNLDQQVQQRAEAARKQQRLLMIVGAVAAVLLIAGVVFVVLRDDDPGNVNATDSSSSSTSETADTPATPAAAGQLPKFTASPQLGADCQYPKARPATKSVEPPRTGKVPTDPAQVSVSMLTDQGPIGLMLNNAQSPCTVNSFISLAAKDYFSGTQCHRLTTSPMLSVLQCGDPAGDGTGGPGYEFDNEYPTDQYTLGDPAAQQPVTYPRGTVAMANAGPGTNGSQFFLVYKDSMLPPQYTVFGTIQADGLATLDKIAAAGVQGGGDDGPPATKVTVKSVQAD
ncbi:peptidylprolyl isomerase [Mycolicibacter arupensis]|uniref:Peptidyl-prolyl cis-trans isomerase n=1 Tax=Mycolicibacter arupensis TaxID=342002 RepID=A0A0F5MXD0_9MYCO|nr:peptidylprolyl isomerase [Mycolicibacter arupensis]KAA1430505.1 peptidylprolyl isomerase [Mycolicibacter arupensis]KKB99425.1 peptidylprolyl isomerase [Mycolicibacter arupensis]MCV7278025.1 peptidylprolyl isomerase [Mycolicibacter arupensis]OQZ94214.1 peptidylprolyl isomerase [Mycolicibacter arupensis]TXI51005.1 MAG: peptidylprolyl isomerase [Mycolicibacter arupensis]